MESKGRLQCLIILALLALQQHQITSASPLVTKDQWILNSTDHQRISLKCANWYGAHQELHVVGGLELRSVSQLAALFQASGANCVRLPYSVEMVKYNPRVNPAAIAGILPTDNCNSTLRALDVMDCVVAHLQSRGILIIFNNHNSRSSWVGAGAVNNKQGLWNVPGYSTEDWIQSMEAITRRYKIAGMDLRNEIHDHGGVKITWGKTNNVDTDWLAASTAAYERLYQVDPDILAIVGGLCWNTDIRTMMQNVGPLRAFKNKKLVYTVHIYTFSFWWNDQAVLRDVITPLSIWLFLFCLFAGIACLYNLYAVRSASKEYNFLYKQLELSEYPSSERRGEVYARRQFWPNTAWAVVSTSIIFSAGWLALSIFYYNTATTAGCSSFAEDAVWLIVMASITTVLALCVGLGWVYSRHEVKWLPVLTFGLLWLSLFCLCIFALGSYLASHASYTDSLGSWSLDNRPVPVWVGEFGTGNPNEPIFKLIWDFIHTKYDLDFAYWAFNGRKWWDGAWESESFGLMNDQYSDWRFPQFMHAMFQ